MDPLQIRELIVQHKERFLKWDGLVHREKEDDIKKFLTHKEVIVLSGVRRSGKSSMLKLICGYLIGSMDVTASNILYLNFEDERFVTFKPSDFENIIKAFHELEAPSGRLYFFLDEIQQAPLWERWINRLYETADIKFFITGSNASMLAPEIAAKLTGRNRQVVTFPFSFREYLSFHNIEFDKKSILQTAIAGKIKGEFNKYLETGGFPEVVKTGDKTLLEQYYQDIIYRDVISRNAVKNIKELKELVLYLSSNNGSIVSYKKIRDMIGLKSIGSVKNYLDMLEDVYLYFPIGIFDFSVRRQIYNPKKYYCVDVGLNNSSNFRFMQNKGRMFENTVFIELMRNNSDVYYWKSKKGNEVDFLVRKGGAIETAIQVCVTLQQRQTYEREINGLELISRELNPRKLFILTENEERTLKVNGKKVIVMPLWKWLLAEQM